MSCAFYVAKDIFERQASVRGLRACDELRVERKEAKQEMGYFSDTDGRTERKSRREHVRAQRGASSVVYVPGPPNSVNTFQDQQPASRK
jgi:hypothetical protein